MRLDFCVACNNKTDLHQHHLVPKVLGGADTQDNLITLCQVCHSKMHRLQTKGLLNGATLSEVGQWLALAEGRSPESGGSNLTAEAAAEEALNFAEALRPAVEEFLSATNKLNRPTIAKLASFLSLKEIPNRQGTLSWSSGQTYELLSRLQIDWVAAKKAARATDPKSEVNKNELARLAALQRAVDAVTLVKPFVQAYLSTTGREPPAVWIAAKLNELQSIKTVNGAWTAANVRTALNRVKAVLPDPWK